MIFSPFKAAITSLLVVAAPLVIADSKISMNLQAAPKSWRAECASCHTAFPPSLLSSNDWKRIMQTLDKHYGSDASVTPQEVQEISQFLVANASTQGSQHVSSVNPPRLTKTAWFERKHRKVPAAAWQDVRIKSASNCAACHTQAAKDSFSERDISVPGYPGKHW
jgi:Dihaem cytochrome c